MLSYRHGYHAGNFADVLKHVVLVAILEYLKKKDAPFYYHDTHAGAGSYRVSHSYMQKNREYADGIARLWDARPKSALLKGYLAILHQLNPGPALETCPGSPEIAACMLRKGDRAWLGERHTTDFRILSRHFGDRSGFHCEMLDAWEGLKAKLPPKERRGLVLIDPSYEIDSDYRQLSKAVDDALQRFAQGIYAIWYPLIDEYAAEKLVQRLAVLPAKDKLHLRLDTGAGKPGMHGCGMVILNPPYTLQEMMQQTMPELVTLLERHKSRGHSLVESLTA